MFMKAKSFSNPNHKYQRKNKMSTPTKTPGLEDVIHKGIAISFTPKDDGFTMADYYKDGTKIATTKFFDVCIENTVLQAINYCEQLIRVRAQARTIQIVDFGMKLSGIIPKRAYIKTQVLGIDRKFSLRNGEVLFGKLNDRITVFVDTPYNQDIKELYLACGADIDEDFTEKFNSTYATKHERADLLNAQNHINDIRCSIY